MNLAERVKKRRLQLGWSQDELAKKMGYSSRSSINKIEHGRPISQKIISKLADVLGVSEIYLMGYDDVPNVPNIFIPNRQPVPMVGSIACGEPIYADEEHGEFVEADSSIKADFCLRAEGDSMIDARIRNGDIVFCRKTDMVNNGQIAAVIIGEEATLKRFYYYPESNLVILKPANPDYPDLIYQGEQLNEIRVIGRAVAAQIRI